MNSELAAKLGFEPGDSLFVETTPDWYTGFADENGLELEPGLPATHAHLFCFGKQDLTTFLDDYSLSDIEKSLWVSWPKASSDKQAELSDNQIRELLLPLGWVDNKVVSLDDTWSALRFTRRK